MPSSWTSLRRHAGIFALLAFITVTIVFLTVHHELRPLVGIRIFAALYFLQIIPGYLAQRYLFRIRTGGAFESLLSSLLLGLILTPLVWFGMCRLGVAVVFAPLMIALGISVPFMLGWHHNVASRLGQLVTRQDAPILGLALLLMMLWGRSLPLVEIHDGQAYTIPNQDLIFHAGQVAELSRGVPAGAFPYIANVQSVAYHDMPDIWCDLMRRATGADPLDAYFHIALPLRYMFLVLGAYLALIRRFGRTAALAGAGCMLAVVEPVRNIVSGGPLIMLNHGYPAAFGLAGTLLCVYYVTTMDRRRWRGPLLLASLVSSLLLCYKANFALVVAPAVGLFAAIELLKRRDYRWLALCFAVQAVVVGIRYVQLQTADMRHPMVFAPLAYLRWEWCGLPLPDAWALLLRNSVESFPKIIEWPIILTILFFYRFHVGVAVMVYLVGWCGFARKREPVNGLDRLLVLIFCVCLLGFIFFPVPEGVVWDVAQHLRVLIHALIFLLMGPALCMFARTLATRRKAVLVPVSIGLLLAFTANAFTLYHKAFVEIRAPEAMGSEQLYSCYKFVESSTPADSVILHNQRLPSGFEACALTQRRMVLEVGGAWWLMHDMHQIIWDVVEFYRGVPREYARGIIERYNIDYIIADLSTSRLPDLGDTLSPVFRNGSCVVYRIDHTADISKVTQTASSAKP